MSVSYEFDRSPGAVLLRFPTVAVRRRAAARRRALALRRTVTAVALLAVLVLVLLGGGGPSTATARSAHSGSPHAVVLRSGQTVWDLAERYAPPSVDPRAYVDQVFELNHLNAAPAAGVKIRLPH